MKTEKKLVISTLIANEYAKNAPLDPERHHYAVSPPERLHSDAALGLGGRVCVVVGNEDGNRQFFFCFQY